MRPKSDAASTTSKNRPIQLNPNNDAFWQSRKYPARPLDWVTRDPNSAPPPGPRGKRPKK
jgi:hypothetical protein